MFAQGGIKNFHESIPIYVKAVAQDPGSFEANWKCARAQTSFEKAYTIDKTYDQGGPMLSLGRF